MAISDTLSSAVAEIAAYRAARPDAYAELAARLDDLIAEMTAIRIVLDTPPDERREG